MVSVGDVTGAAVFLVTAFTGAGFAVPDFVVAALFEVVVFEVVLGVAFEVGLTPLT